MEWVRKDATAAVQRGRESNTLLSERFRDTSLTDSDSHMFFDHDVMDPNRFLQRRSIRSKNCE